MPRNVENVVSSIGELVSSLGLEKLAAEDPGTSHPAEKTDANANTQPAVEGARSAENSADVKSEVPGQSVDEANPGDVDKDGVPELTTATMTGEDPKVENDYKGNTEDPGTSHPANANNKTEKYSAEQVKSAAALIIAEATTIADNTVADAAEATTKLAALAKEIDETATAETAIGQYIQDYAKSAALVGELTADYLDGISAGVVEKGAEMPGEEGLMPAPGGEAGAEPTIEELMGSAPPEAMMDGAVAPDEMGAGMEEEAAALAEAATEIAAELGVSPEEVLEAALAETEGGAAGAEGAPMEAPAPEIEPELDPALAESAAPGVDEQMIAEAAVATEKAAKYDALMALKEKAAQEKAEEVRLETVLHKVLKDAAAAAK